MRDIRFLMLFMARSTASLFIASRTAWRYGHATLAARSRNRILLALGILCSALLFRVSPLASLGQTQVRGSVEILLSEENAYNPIPSPDGKMIAYVRTGWGRSGGTGGFGRSNLLTEVEVMDSDGAAITKAPLADAFIAAWTPDGKGLVCYRDWQYSLIALDGTRISGGELPEEVDGAEHPERVSYMPSLGTIAWSREDRPSHTLLETPEFQIAEHDTWLGEFIVPSPDGRYLAVFNDSISEIGGRIWIYDMRLKKWSDLGLHSVHPYDYWDYIQPTWNPWFADSSRLAFISGENLVISKPDGGERISIPVGANAGLTAPSPDGKSVAFATFEPRPDESRPDLQFWGGTTIWVVSVNPGSKPYAVTEKVSAETYDLKWLNYGAILFDRIDDVSFYKKARIWKVLLSR